MNLIKLDQALIAIIEKKEELNTISVNDPGYYTREMELKKLEDKFLAAFGSYMEEVIFSVHDEYCPDNDIMKPVAYIASRYIKKHDRVCDVPKSEGIPVECDDFPGVKVRLVLMPTPTRLILQAENENFREVVWKAT